MSERWAYLGPEGTFTEQAARSLAATGQGAGAASGLGSPSSPDVPELVPAPSVPAALDAVRTHGADAAVVPLENSVEGSVSLTLDELIHGLPLRIAGEAFVAVRFDLLARPGTTMADVGAVGSHPHGLAQVRGFLAARLPGVRIVETSSTAAAAAAVAAGELDAAAAAAVAGERHNLIALASDIGLDSAAVTRFVLVRRPGDPAPATGADRTSMVLTVPNRPGTLLAVLAQIADRGVNLTRLESRPTRAVMGEYLFVVDADGHADDPAITDLLAALRERNALLRFLGSYPAGPEARGTAHGA